MHRERYWRGRFVGWGRSLIPTPSLTPQQPRSAAPPTQTWIPSIASQYRLLEVLRSEIQSKGSPTSSIKVAIEVDPTSPTIWIILLSSTGEKLLAQELEVLAEEEEEETYFIQTIDRGTRRIIRKTRYTYCRTRYLFWGIHLGWRRRRRSTQCQWWTT